MTTSDNISAIEKTDEFIEQIAIQLHSRDSDDHTLKWAKQSGKYRASLRRDVRDVVAALSECGFEVFRRSAILAEARKAVAMEREIAELREQMGYWQRGHERIEECLADCVRADPLDAPIPFVGVEAKRWHAYRGEAFRHALEMMGIPEEFRARTLLNGGSDAQG